MLYPLQDSDGGPFCSEAGSADMSTTSPKVRKGSNDQVQACLWDGSAVRALGVLTGTDGTDAYGVNSIGQVVGECTKTIDFPSNIRYTAFLWESGALKDLNSLIDSTQGWELRKARDINDAGMIVGFGTHNGISRAFLLTPK